MRSILLFVNDDGRQESWTAERTTAQRNRQPIPDCRHRPTNQPFRQSTTRAPAMTAGIVILELAFPVEWRMHQRESVKTMFKSTPQTPDRPQLRRAQSNIIIAETPEGAYECCVSSIYPKWTLFFGDELNRYVVTYNVRKSASFRWSL